MFKNRYFRLSAGKNVSTSVVMTPERFVARPARGRYVYLGALFRASVLLLVLIGMDLVHARVHVYMCTNFTFGIESQ